MKKLLSEKILSTLAFSFCNHELAKSFHGLICQNCKTAYSYDNSGSLDLRLRKNRKVQVEFELGASFDDFPVAPLSMNADPQVDFTQFKLPHHLTKALLSHFPKASQPDILALDLGCGNGIHRKACEKAGFEWVGLDYNSPGAPILGDGHALPFRTNTFEFILSIAVLEHIRYPFVMMKEANRVLQPKGTFIGSIAFLEPFHGNSFYHHTHLGLLNCLQNGGFRVKKISATADWHVLKAQAHMSLFPKMPRWISSSIIYPVQFLHKLWWRLGALSSSKSTEEKRIKNTAGAFFFMATKDS